MIGMAVVAPRQAETGQERHGDSGPIAAQLCWPIRPEGIGEMASLLASCELLERALRVVRQRTLEAIAFVPPDPPKPKRPRRGGKAA